MNWTAAVRRIRDDSLSGAQTITKRTAALLDEWVAAAPSDPRRLEAELLELGAELSDPGAAPAPALPRRLDPGSRPG